MASGAGVAIDVPAVARCISIRQISQPAFLPGPFRFSAMWGATDRILPPPARFAPFPARRRSGPLAACCIASLVPKLLPRAERIAAIVSEGATGRSFAPLRRRCLACRQVHGHLCPCFAEGSGPSDTRIPKSVRFPPATPAASDRVVALRAPARTTPLPLGSSRRAGAAMQAAPAGLGRASSEGRSLRLEATEIHHAEHRHSRRQCRR